MMNYLITVNDEKLNIKKNDSDQLDMIEVGDSSFHLLQENKAYEVRLVHHNFLDKTLTLSVNGNLYDLKIEDEYDLQVNKMGLLAVSSQKVNSIKAPMPGLILDIMVTKGQEVEEGTPLLVLSAMKMENVILSQGAGIVKEITVKKDEPVEKGQLIIELE